MALLATGQFVMADLFTFTLASGTVLRFTSADMAVTVNGHTFSDTGPLITRGSTRTAVGLEVDVLDVKVRADATHLVDGLPFVLAARTGAFDGAEVSLERAFGPAWNQPMIATVDLFAGRTADIDYDNGLTIPVKSHTELLDAPVPGNIYQPSCMNTLYDAACGIDRAARMQAGAVTGGTANSITTNLTSRPEGYFALGVLAFTSGANSGVTRSVKWDVSGSFDFALPLPSPPSAGDAFTVVPGCDRMQSTCESKFNNKIRFRGQPYIPAPETTAPG
jgi:uncharacterized phage protein (TIGR02218 family)